MLAVRASSTPYCNKGLVSIGIISLGAALVASKKWVPYPAAGKNNYQFTLKEYNQ